MNVQLKPEVARIVDGVTAESGYSADEIVNRTLTIWFGLMALCCDDDQADAFVMELVARAKALARLDAERCTRCGRLLLPREHTREQGICHSCWADEMAAKATQRRED